MTGRALPLALLAGLALVQLAGAQCTLGLDIDQPKSPVSAGGQLVQPLQEAILVNSSQQLSLSGKLYLSFPGGACPETPQTFANALPGAVFVTPGDAEPVQLQPPAFSAQVRLAGCCACIRGAAARLCVHLTAPPSVASCADWNCRFSVCHLPRSGVQPQLGSVASATCKASQWSVQDNTQCASRKRAAHPCRPVCQLLGVGPVEGTHLSRCPA